MDQSEGIQVIHSVFVSSTYEDLKEERQLVMNTLAQLDAIPYAMELYPSADESALQFIYSQIESCDYYVVVIGGRYGSVDEKTGLSYTELEYQHAEKVGVPILGFIKDRSTIPGDQLDGASESGQKLAEFVERVKKRLCRFFQNPHHLAMEVSTSFSRIRKSNPRDGWVRAKFADNTLLRQVNDLRNENDSLRARLSRFEASGPGGTDDLAQGADLLELECILDPGGQPKRMNLSISWEECFLLCAKVMRVAVPEQYLGRRLGEHFAVQLGEKVSVWQPEMDKLFNQFTALGLVEAAPSEQSQPVRDRFWALTDFGQKQMARAMAIKRPSRSLEEVIL